MVSSELLFANQSIVTVKKNLDEYIEKEKRNITLLESPFYRKESKHIKNILAVFYKVQYVYLQNIFLKIKDLESSWILFEAYLSVENLAKDMFLKYLDDSNEVYCRRLEITKERKIDRKVKIGDRENNEIFEGEITQIRAVFLNNLQRFLAKFSCV